MKVRGGGETTRRRDDETTRRRDDYSDSEPRSVNLDLVLRLPLPPFEHVLRSYTDSNANRSALPRPAVERTHTPDLRLATNLSKAPSFARDKNLGTSTEETFFPPTNTERIYPSQR